MRGDNTRKFYILNPREQDYMLAGTLVVCESGSECE